MADGSKGAWGVDATLPNLARMYDYWLGGKDNFTADREAAAGLAAAIPQLPLLARENRRFVGRAVRFCARAGVTQFLDIGSGLPTVENVHEAAGEVTGDVRVVYADSDPVVVSHARALLATERTRAVRADLTSPGEVLAAAAATGLVDFARPVAVLLAGVLHHVPDEADPAGAVARLRAAVAPGSYLVISHAQLAAGHMAGTKPTSQTGREIAAAHAGAPRGNGTRTREEIAAFFGGLTLVEPGLAEVWDWRPEGRTVAVEPGVLTILGGVAVKD
jgi:S-adenosyl methyltransferase